MLFAVNGVAEGEYDINIPKAYFQTPPARLGGDDPDLEALRVGASTVLSSCLEAQFKSVSIPLAPPFWVNETETGLAFGE